MAEIDSTRRRMLGLGLAVCIALAAFVAAMIRREPNTETRPESEIALAESGDHVAYTITDPSGSETRVTSSPDGVELPDAWPKDFPIFADAIVTTTATTDIGMMLTLATQSTMADAFDFYREQLSRDGWSLDAETVDPNGKTLSASSETLSASKGERMRTVIMNFDGEQTKITLIAESAVARP